MALLTIVTLVIVCVIAVVALIILIGLVVFTQKHCANKRKRLEGSLVQNDAAAVFCVCVNYNTAFVIMKAITILKENGCWRWFRLGELQVHCNGGFP